MTEKKKLSARPPFRLPLASIKEKELEFIHGGTIEPMPNDPGPRREFLLPWERSDVRADVMKVFNLRLSEPDFLKLKYLAERKSKSINSVCVSLIKDFLDTELKF